MTFAHDPQANIGFLCLTISLVSSLIFVPLNKFHLSWKVAALLITYYAIFLIMSVLIEAGQMKPL